MNKEEIQKDYEKKVQKVLDLLKELNLTLNINLIDTTKYDIQKPESGEKR